MLNVRLRITHKNGRKVIDSYNPIDPCVIYTQGWHTDFHDNPVYSAVVCMRVWTVFNQDTLMNIFDRCLDNIHIIRRKKEVIK